MLTTNKLAVVILTFTVLRMTRFVRSEGSGFELREKHASRAIVLRKCCKDYEFYVLGFDSCLNKTKEMPNSWPPPVYESETRRKVEVDLTSFSPIVNLTSCPNDETIATSTDFRLNIDGTVTLADELEPNDFCISQIVGKSAMGEAEFVVRYCIPDPCKDVHCIRKCCPPGMAFVDNNDVPVCQTLAMDHSRFDVVLRSNTGRVVSPDPQSYVIQHGNNVPKCRAGTTFYSPEETPENLFHIQADGQAYITYNHEEEKLTSHYCTDDYFLDGAYVSITGFPDEFVHKSKVD